MDDVLFCIRVLTLLIVFAGSCIGLGYFAGYLSGRRAWPTWSTSCASVIIAMIWPLIAASAAVYGAHHYHRRYEGDPGDGPAMVLVSVITEVVPVLFLLGLTLALFGASLARRKTRSVDSPPNKTRDVTTA